MSRSVNRAILVGHVGRDPEIRTTAKGTMMAKVSLATNDGWGDNEKTNWHRLTFFGKTAEIVEQYVQKGDRIFVEGRIDYSQTEGEDGSTRYWVDIIVDDLVLLGSLDPERGAVTKAGVSDPDDDMPF